MRKLLIGKEVIQKGNVKEQNFSFRYLPSIFDKYPKDFNYQIKLVDEDIKEIEKEIAELRPLANRLNKLRKELQLYEEFRALLIKENNRLFDEKMKGEDV